MRVTSGTAALLVSVALLAGIAEPAAAQQVDPFNPLGHFIYPAADQTAEQAEKDKSACYAWASEQNQFDPYAAYQKSAAAQQQAAAAGQPQGDIIGGAARGAIGGLIIGEIAGDAGEGAAIGAVAGGLMGSMKRRSRRNSAEAEAAQAQAEAEAMLQSWDRAYMACLQGRKYTVG
jgi:outer membrane lipoprotein SlyB